MNNENECGAFAALKAHCAEQPAIYAFLLIHECICLKIASRMADASLRNLNRRFMEKLSFLHRTSFPPLHSPLTPRHWQTAMAGLRQNKPFLWHVYLLAKAHIEFDLVEALVETEFFDRKVFDSLEDLIVDCTRANLEANMKYPSQLVFNLDPKKFFLRRSVRKLRSKAWLEAERRRRNPRSDAAYGGPN